MTPTIPATATSARTASNLVTIVGEVKRARRPLEIGHSPMTPTASSTDTTPGVRTRAALAALLTLLVAAPAQAAVSVDLRSSYGSGNFGRWETDALGLPRFRYDVDESQDPRAKQPELAGGTLAQHQLGNDHIVANAYNDGHTQFWSQDREPQWANLYQPDGRHWSGGYGYLNVGGRVLSTNYADATGKPLCWFGVGYYRRDLRAAGLDV